MAEEAGDIDRLIEMSEEELIAIGGIEKKTAKGIREFFAEKENRREIN